MRRAGAYLLLGAALALIAASTLTPTGAASGRLPVAWCLTCGPNWLSDAISNVALFVPLGVALAFVGMGYGNAFLVGAGLSLAVELLQYMGTPSGRTPALSDWLTNSLGTLIGAALVSARATLLLPSRPIARRLLSLWTLTVGAVGLVSSWLLSSASPSRGPTNPVAVSALPFTPGYGWYSANPDSGLVNGVRISHRGNGPIIAEMARTDTVRLSVLVRGRDARRFTVPILYVHAPGEQRAYVVLGQRGTSAVVRLAMKARRYGLVAPELALHNVFAPDARPVSSSVRLDASIAYGSMSLSAREDSPDRPVRRITLDVTPGIGWALIQGVVRVDSDTAPLATALWLLFWFVPGGIWTVRAGAYTLGTARAVAVSIVWALLMIGLTDAGAAAFAIQPLRWWDTLLAVLGSALGAALPLRQDRPILRPSPS